MLLTSASEALNDGETCPLWQHYCVLVVVWGVASAAAHVGQGGLIG